MCFTWQCYHLDRLISSFGTSTREAGRTSSAQSVDKATEAQTKFVSTSESSGGRTSLAGAWESMTDRPQDTVATGSAGGAKHGEYQDVRTRFEALEARNGGLRFFTGFPGPDTGPALKKC